MQGIIVRYKKDHGQSSDSAISLSQANTQFYQQEAIKMRQQITQLENTNRHLMGVAIGSMSIKELKQLETRLEKSLNRIRSKKEAELDQDNRYLERKIAERQQSMNLQAANAYQVKVDATEREQQMALIIANEYEAMNLNNFSSQIYYPAVSQQSGQPRRHQRMIGLAKVQ
ncbi:hypothetical protein GIB67_043271 [Kingdonia uniflora]|uniref:K-box domain-containing protein n=1 Tax=Kingdonia uniflora TaxID=39325 RepID=A0A7J7L0K0_9MAGN|nr:hypothetical protein GIB67_043271 [Kingdonia uniflora]